VNISFEVNMKSILNTFTFNLPCSLFCWIYQYMFFKRKKRTANTLFCLTLMDKKLNGLLM